MNDYSDTPGKTTIAPDVLISIARLTTLSVSGVGHLAAKSKKLDRIFRRRDQEGVDVSIQDGRVYMDIYVVLMRDVVVRDVCHSIQQHVSRAISEMVGMDVGKINIHVEDIEYSES
jgi:uncharacterized alkaline shock family protein YloU